VLSGTGPQRVLRKVGILAVHRLKISFPRRFSPLVGPQWVARNHSAAYNLATIASG